ncbi:MAG: right-handed parallel beta-helix repeat-containing protein [Bacteroidales bacterium]|nr:right-handed parallel beta-helix repeat-containing protein [Bacteroidales bacterium]
MFTQSFLCYLSFIDYRWGETFEVFFDQQNIPILDFTNTFLTINYDLIPHETNITSDLILYSDMVSRFNPTVDNNSTLTVNDIDIDMYNSTITIKDGSNMVINDHAVFCAKQGNCRIIIDGDIQVGTDVHFIAEPGATLELIINNSDEFLTINSCEFENCTVTSSAQSVTITNSNFSYSNIYCENGKKNSETATITNNTFNDGSHIAIDVYSFENYSIDQNSINNMKGGIMLSMCGDGVPGNQTIANNDIVNCTGVGIHLYESVSYISENLVSLCNEGIRLENKSTTSIYGNPNATSYSQMNRFYNADSYELYISKYSFPWYFHYNAIIDEDNGGNVLGDPMLYYDNVGDVNQQAPKDVEYNCWGTNFNAQMDLYPVNGFDYSPTYCPPYAPMQTSPAETLYQNSLDQFTAGDYTQSQSGFMFLINQYPNTKYAQSAMNELLVLEEYVDNDYVKLKAYYLTNTTIQSDEILAPLGSKLANECDIKLENYSEAVDYFEAVIADPADTQDSVYAIIDLGYLYETMGAGNKAVYVGKMPQYKPKSFTEFKKYKHNLLSLLPVTKATQTGLADIDGNVKELFSIQPNPVRDATSFRYVLETEGKVQFIIYATDGTQIHCLSEGIQESGSHDVNYQSSRLDAGVYYCSLLVNGVVLETKKMVVLR